MHLLLRKGLGVFLTAFTLLVSAEAQFFPTITIRLTDIPNNTKMCFTSTFSLAGTVTPFSPVYNTDFNFFLNGIAGSFSSYPRVVSAIKNTNYSYMAGYLYLWDDLSSNKNTIAYDLRREVMSRNTYLTNEEMNAIYNNFFAAAYAQSSWPPPYYSYLYKWEYKDSISGSIVTWKTLSNPIGESAIVKFVPKSFLPALPDKSTIIIRALAFNTYTSKYSASNSNVIMVDVLPEPPKAGSISVTSSCAGTPTGEINVSGITSNVPEGISKYNYNLIDSDVQYLVGPNDQSVWPKSPDIITGSTIRKGAIKAGKYKLYLSYENTSIKNCFDPYLIEIPELPVLQSEIAHTDISCPGGNDGSIGVKITNGAGSYQISINDSPINTFDHTFETLRSGNYKITTTDFCTSHNEDVVLTEPKTIVIKPITIFQPTCISNPNGGFKVEASGGENGNFSYFIYKESDYPYEVPIRSGLEQGAVWEDKTLSPGRYIINVRDSDKPLCKGVVTTSLVLNPVVPLNLTLKSKTNIVCFGESTGEIQLIGSGGSGCYNIKLGSKIITTNPAIFSSLSKGSYNFEITNNDQTCGDVKPFTEEISSNEKINITLTPQDVKCFGNQDGQINTVVNSGTGSYRYFTWEIFKNDNWNPYPSFVQLPKDLDIGLYRLTVEDNGGCKAAAITEIKQPSSLSITNVSKVDARCFGETGKIDIASSGGNGGDIYQYSVNDVDYSTFSSGSSFGKGLYSLKVRDLKGCETKLGYKVEINEPELLDFTYTSPKYNGYDLKCFGESDGSITLTGKGGNQGYIFSFDGVNFQSQNQFSNLAAGTYNITVKDVLNCSTTKSVTLTQPLKLNLPIPVVEDVKCFGQATGKIVVNPTGGVSPYVSEINGTSHGSSSEFSLLLAGSYSIKVSDKNGCNQTLSANVINKNQPIRTTLTPQNVRCAGENNGQIAVITSGGSGGFNHTWEKVPGSTLSSGSGIPDIQGLSPGLYRLRLKDSDQCSASDSAKIMTPLPLSISGVTPHDIICFGGSGSIDISAAGGNGGYTFSNSIDNWVSNSTFISGVPLSAAVYKLKVTDIKGCETKWNSDVKITAPDSPLSFSTALSGFNGFNISCYALSDGSIAVTPSGGNGAGYNGYSYSFKGGSFNPQSIYVNLTSGTYAIIVKDGRGCSVNRSVIITQPAQIGLEITKLVKTKCFNDSSGVITLAASGGAQPYEYMIGQKYYVADNEFGKLSMGNYQFTVKDKNGCLNTVSSDITSSYPKPAIALFPQDISCYQKNDGVIQSSLAGGSGSFGLKWYLKSAGLWQYLKADSTKITSLAPGDYRLQVTDLAGCPAIYDSTSISQKVTQLVIDHLLMKDIVCSGETGSIDIQASGSNGGYIYQYSKANMPFVSYSSGAPLSAGSYKLKVKDAKGCETIWPDNKIITSPSAALGLTWLAKDYNGYNVSCFGNTNGRLVVKPSGGNGAGYQGYSILFSGRPIQTDTLFDNLSAGSYNIRITDGRGCTINNPVSLTQPSAPVGLSVSKLVDTKCFNDSTGIITLSATGGVQPYEFSIDQNSFAGTNEFGKLPAGSYYFSVRDKNGCSNYLSSKITNIYPKPFLSLKPQEISCYQKNDGLIQSTLTGGSGNFGLKWYLKTGNLWQYYKSDSTKITSLAPGDYRIQATDLAGCPAIYDSAVVFQKVTPLIIDKVSFKDIICYSDSGSIDIQASGSNGGYSFLYSKDNRPYEEYVPGAPLPFASYKLKVRDVRGCETIWPENIEITSPSDPLDLNWTAKDFNGSNVSCFGNSDGSIIVNPSGGNGAGYHGYSYLLSGRSVQTDTLFPNLTAGIYTVSVTDARGCSVNRSASLKQPSAPVGLMVSQLTDTKCFNDSTGIITLAASGGVKSYEFSIDRKSFFATNEFGKLPTGNYDFTVRDKNGCSTSTSSVITNIYPKPAIKLLPQEISCYQKNDGLIQSSIEGGSGSFSLKWFLKSANSWQYLKSDSTKISQLAPGEYRIQATDMANCPSISDSTIVYQKVTPLVIKDVLTRDIICYGDSGSIDIQASGSNGGYIYQYSKDNQPYANYSPGTPISAGSYKLKVKDAKGCETLWPDSQIITHPENPLDFSWIAKDYAGYNVSCFGNSDGHLTVKPSGGNSSGYSGYSFILSGRSVQTDTLFDKLYAGDYTLDVKDGRGCLVTKRVSLKQAKSELGLWVSNLKMATCINDSNGMVSLVASGGSIPYSYSADNKIFFPGNEFSNLKVNDYRFTVKDANGCTQILDTTIVNIIPEMLITGIVNDAQCIGQNNGEITAKVSGGALPFNYNWKENSLTTSSIGNLYKGEYTLSVIDSAGCIATRAFKVGEPAIPLIINHVKQNDIICYGDSGSIDIQASGSNGGYSFLYSKDSRPYEEYVPGAPLPFASYKLKVRDVKGCETIWPENIEITSPSDALDLIWIAKDFNGSNVSCFGKSDGSIIVNPSGGNGAGYHGYSYLLSGRSVQTDTLFTNLTAGTYTVSITDARGCSVNRSASLKQPSAPVGLAISQLTDTKCFNDSTGIITLAASGGVKSYEFSIDRKNFFATNEFGKLPTGNYDFTVRDKNGCSTSMSSVITNIYPKPVIKLLPQEISCYQKNDGLIQSSIEGGSGSFSLKWFLKSANSWQYLKSDSTKISQLAPGEYRIQATDMANCPSISDSTTVYQKVTPLVIKDVLTRDIICYGDSGKIDIQAWGSNGGYTYQYSRDNLPFADFLSGSHFPSAVYKLKVRDSKGCETLWSENVVITQPPKVLDLTWHTKDYNGSNVSCFGRNDGQLFVKANGGNGIGYKGYSYNFTGRIVQTDTVYNNLAAGLYNVSVKDGRGCTITRLIPIKQPDSPVGLMVSKIIDTKCFNDSTGTITLTASGGVKSYEYSIDQNSFVTSNEFGKLPKGFYSFSVRDMNGCSSTVNSSIRYIYPIPAIKLIAQDIKCYQKNDGSVKATLTGGSGSFGLKWYMKSGNTWQFIKSDSSRVTGLSPGDYLIQATDILQCPSVFDSTTIFQKVGPLNVTAISEAACASSPDGTIIPSASGGIPPYLFAVDQLAFQNKTSFNVYSGKHKVYSSDANKCISETEVHVNVKNVLPAINFLVATSRYEFDTLVIKDVSLPKPDRVSWEFSPEALLIATNQYEAKVKYNSAGIYPVRMTGYFGTCDYTLEKLLNISPFDPLVTPKDKYLSGIESVQISPNPNNGQFRIKVKLYTKQQIQIKILDYYSKLWHSSRYPFAMEFEQEINIPGALPGTYVLWVISENDSRALLFIISQ